MINGKTVIVVLPAYKAASTLEKTIADIPMDTVDQIIMVDDASNDDTVAKAAALGIETIVHESNRGYGANQKTCYHAALDKGADIVVMLHPDYQYNPKLVTAMAAMVSTDVYDIVLGSRMLCGSALKGGMPVYKYIANRALTALQNLLIQTRLSEFHTGYRAYSRKALLKIPFDNNSDDFIFDNQLLVQVKALGLSIGEISCPAKYFPEASSINFTRSVKYGWGVVANSFGYALWKLKLYKPDYLP